MLLIKTGPTAVEATRKGRPYVTELKWLKGDTQIWKRRLCRETVSRMEFGERLRTVS
jgi:hypothetical protein